MVLTMVLIVSTTVLAVVTGMMLRSIGEVNQSSDSEKSLKAWAAANACGEYALLQLSSTTDTTGWGYAGEELLTVGDVTEAKTCYINEVTVSGTAKLIQASSTVSSFTRKVEITVATNTPTTTVSSWNIVADF